MSGETAAPGWYPAEEGRTRWWDGSQWTDQYRDGEERSALGNTLRSAAAGATQRVMSTEWSVPEGTIWSAVGKPLTGIGAGRYRLDQHYLYFEKGMLRTDSQQVPISAVVDVDVRQSMRQKARGVYDVLVHIQRSHGIEVVTMDDIPDGRAAQQVINETAHKARLAIQRNQNTMRYEGVVSPTPVAMASAAASAESDLVGQLRKLGELRDAGILTDEEFTAKKAEILARL